MQISKKTETILEKKMLENYSKIKKSVRFVLQNLWPLCSLFNVLYTQIANFNLKSKIQFNSLKVLLTLRPYAKAWRHKLHSPKSLFKLLLWLSIGSCRGRRGYSRERATLFKTLDLSQFASNRSETLPNISLIIKEQMTRWQFFVA